MADLTPAQRAAHASDLEAERAFHLSLAPAGGFLWVRRFDEDSEAWTVAQIAKCGDAYVIDCEQRVDLRRAEIGPAIAAPPT